MPKKSKEAKKPPTHYDLLLAFCKGKFIPLEVNNLKMEKHKAGMLRLTYDGQCIAEHGKFEGSTGERKIMIVNPVAGTADIWRSIFGGYPSQSIYYRKGLTPINIHQAMEIYTHANSPLLQMES